MSLLPSGGIRAARIVLLIVAIFFTAAAAFSLLIAGTLLEPGTALDGVWALKPQSRTGFESMGVLGPVLLIVLAAVLAIAAAGLYRRRQWARWVAFALLAINVIADAIQGLAGNYVIFIPISIVAVITIYLALPIVGRASREN